MFSGLPNILYGLKIRVEHLKYDMLIIFPELKRCNYERLADYDSLPVEVLKTQDLPPYSIKWPIFWHEKYFNLAHSSWRFFKDNKVQHLP
jgi:hypothetical protein